MPKKQPQPRKNYANLLSIAFALLGTTAWPVLSTAWDFGRAADQYDVLTGIVVDITSRDFLDTLLQPGDNPFVVAKLVDGALKTVGESVAPDKSPQNVLRGTARTVSILRGQVPENQWDYECRVLKQPHIGGGNRVYPIPNFVRVDTGTVLAKISTEARPNTLEIIDAFLVPKEWTNAIADFWKQKKDPEAIPFTQVTKAKLADWGKAVDSDNPIIGLIALTKLCQSRLVPPAELVKSHLSAVRGVQQAAYLMIIVREARNEDVKALVLAFDDIIRAAKSAEQVHYLAMGMSLSDHGQAFGEIDRILMGSSTDLRGIKALPVGDRIAKLFLKDLRDLCVISQIEGGSTDELIRRALRRVGLNSLQASDPGPADIVGPRE